MWARKSLLARLAASAVALARSSSSCVLLAAVMSRTMTRISSSTNGSSRASK
ncbi:MAG: hypothetical protein LAQ30_27655 [Acidobacteriia bacterium]|nr:hypothetical protein [Terriglobia bacterium]